jgi:hypothetical protein
VRAGGLTLAIVTLASPRPVLYWLLNPGVLHVGAPGRFAEDPVLFGRLDIETETSFSSCAWRRWR